MACRQALASLGFKHVAGRRFVFEKTAPILGWVGLHQASRGGVVTVTPTVGLHAVPVEQLAAKLRGEKYREGAYATVAYRIDAIPGSAALRNPAVEFTDARSARERAADLAEMIKRRALPFFRAHASLDAVLAILRTTPGAQRNSELLAATLWLAGQSAEARQVSEAVMANIERQHPVMRRDLERFFVPFLQMQRQ